MRRIALALTCIALVSSASAQQEKPPTSVCDAARIGARELADCLRTASEKSEAAMQSALAAALKSIESKPKIMATRRARWKHFLNDSQTQWAAWRDEECQDLAPLEATTTGGDPRLACLIERNLRRTADLKARYP